MAKKRNIEIILTRTINGKPESYSIKSDPRGKVLSLAHYRDYEWDTIDYSHDRCPYTALELLAVNTGDWGKDTWQFTSCRQAV